MSTAYVYIRLLQICLELPKIHTNYLKLRVYWKSILFYKTKAMFFLDIKSQCQTVVSNMKFRQQFLYKKCNKPQTPTSNKTIEHVN